MAETPSRIKRIFNTDSWPSNGAFEVNLYVYDGTQIKVTVDDRIPVRWYGRYYSKPFLFLNNGVSPEDAWWLVILEKAMAKLNVNYANMAGGFPEQALKTMSGYPALMYRSTSLANMSDDELFNLIAAADKKNYPMVAGSGRNPSYGLVKGHAFSVLGTQIIKNEYGYEVAKLIKMRNPWGKFEYYGPWSGKSGKWTSYYKK